MICERTNVSIYETEGNETMYMLDAVARADFIAAFSAIRIGLENGKLPTPAKWNHYDVDAITTMHRWLEEGRDFNAAQCKKMFLALRKIDKALSTMPKLCAELGLTYGYQVSSMEAHNWLVARRKEKNRESKRKAKMAALKENITNTYNTFFELYELEE